MTTREIVYDCLPGNYSQTGSGQDWIDIANGNASDGSTIYTTLATSGGSKQLNFLSLMPTDPAWRSRVGEDASQMEVTGVSITINRKTDVVGTARDAVVQLMIDGVLVGNNMAETSENWPTTMTEASYGGAIAVTGDLPTLAELFAGSLGVAVDVVNNSGSFTCVPEIDRVRVRVTISEPDLSGFAKCGCPALEDIHLAHEANQIEAIIGRAGLRASNVTGLIWLLEFSGTDLETGDVVNFYWCNGPSGGFQADADSDGVVDRQYDAVLEQPFEYRYRLLGPQRVVGDISASSGKAVALNTDRRFTYMRDLRFDNRLARVLVGTPEMDYSAFIVVSTTQVERVIVKDRVEVVFLDRRRVLNVTLNPLQFSATHAVAALRNVQMPFPIGGLLENVSAVWETDTKGYLCSDFPLRDIVVTRGNGATISDPGTIDLTNGWFEFGAAPTTEVTFDIEGVEARNVMIESRDATTADWFKTNCTAQLLAFGVDGTASRGFRLTATANNATCNPTVHEAPHSPVQWGYAVHSYYMRMVSGSGIVSLGIDPTPIQLTTEWRRYYVIQTTPSFPIGGITIASNGDVIEVDFGGFEPARLKPSPPIDTTGAVAAVRNYPNTWAAIIKFLLTARCGLVPFIDFDEDSFTKAALLNADTLGRYYTENTAVLDVIGLVLESVGGGLLIDRSNRIYIGRVGLPQTAPSCILTERELFEGYGVEEPDPPIAVVDVKWGRNHTLQRQPFDSSVTPELQERYQREWLFARADDPDVLEELGGVAEAYVEIESMHTSAGGASRKAVRDLALLKEKRRPMLLPTGLNAIEVDPMRSVRVSAEGLTYNPGDARGTVERFVRAVDFNAAEERIDVFGWG